MDLSNSNSPRKLITLKDAAQLLGVSIDALIQWNDFNILKPTITLSGEVGYTQEQIDKFISIQKLSHDDGIELKNEVEPQENEITSQTYLPTEDTSKIFEESGKNPSSLRLISSFLVMTILLIIVVTQQGRLKSLPDHNQLISQDGAGNTKAVLSAQVNSSGLSDSSLGNGTIDVLGSIFNKNFKVKSGTAAAGGSFSPTPFILSKLTQDGEVGTKTDGITNVSSNIGYSQLANFPKTTDKNNNLFDEGGNIKGDTSGSNILALALDAVGVARGDNSIRSAPDSNILLALLALGLISVFLALRKQMFSAKMSAALAVSGNLVNNPEKKKILEINQKADGTVALYFQGKDYKLCKPDLDSESDQFIERLMMLAGPGVKEIDYDSLNDEEISFNASLSKLVTRLGFVGLKRDLFFPRTSKNRVLFRRYITQQDLISMNLTTDKILREF